MTATKDYSQTRIEVLKRAIELDLKLSLEEKAEVISHLEAGKYDMQNAVHAFSVKMDVIMQGSSTSERGARIAEALSELEKECGL